MKVKIEDERDGWLYLPAPPQRIVSLVPSDTYSLCRLGAAARLVGRTKYCVEPLELVADIEALGGTKDPNVARIIELAPDVVIANQEENTKSDIEALHRAKVPILLTLPKRVGDGLAQLGRLARMLDVKDEAVKAVLAQAYHAHRAAEQARRTTEPVRVFVPIWLDPLMTIHGDTYISDLLDLCGGVNVFADRPRRYPLAADIGQAKPLSAEQVASRDTRYPRITLDEVVARKPDVILLPDEPHAFSEADRQVFQSLDVPAANNDRIHFVSGRDLMWPGARSLEGLGRVAALLTQ